MKINIHKPFPAKWAEINSIPQSIFLTITNRPMKNLRLQLSTLFLLICLMIPFVGFSQQKNMAIGLRFGEPTAFNFRKYLNGGKNSLDISLGVNGYAYNRNRKYYDGEYRSGTVLMVHYLWNQKIAGVEGLHWYAGGGIQFGSRRYRKDNNQRDENAFNLGLSGAIGIEYYIPTTPLSAFLELGPYLELVPSPGWLGIDGGLGVRFNF